MRTPLITVVVATKNEEKNIERLLKSLRAQSLPRKYWEVVMVDNSSTDKTREIAKKMLHYVYNRPHLMKAKTILNPRGAQINYAVSLSHSPLIFFPDTDMTFDKTLLKEAVETFAKNDVDALYVPEIVLGRGFFGKIRDFERSFYSETSIDAVRIVRKTLFNKVGGFDTKAIKFGPDDWDFTMTLKEKTHKLSSIKSKIYHHEEWLDITKYLSKKRYYIGTFNSYIKKWGGGNPDIKKQFSFYYRYFGIFTEHGKWKRLLRHPVLTVGMYGLRILVGFTLLRHQLAQILHAK